MLREKRGITLIALVVTIIVLLILAAVSINSILGENGIVTQAKKAQEKTENAKLEEELNLMLADMQIDIATEGTMSGMDNLRGMYRYQIIAENTVRVEIDGIFETTSGLSRATFVMEENSDGNETYKFEDVKKVSEVPDMAVPLYKMMENDTADLEMIDQNDYGTCTITGVKYKDVTYDIYATELSNGMTLTINVREDIAAKKWKNVFTSHYYTIAQDSDNKFWIWNDVTSYYIEDITPMCLNGICPELEELDILDAIYQYDRGGYKKIIGFVETNGNIQLFNDGSFGTGLLVCLNELYPEHLSGIKAKEVYAVEMNGVDAFEPRLESQVGNLNNALIILDKDGKVWSITYDVSLEAFTGYCLNDNLTSLSGVKFDKIVISHMYTSESYFEPVEAEMDYLTILGIDKNDNLWKMQYTDYDAVNNTILSEYTFVAKNISEEETLGTVKDVTVDINQYTAWVIDSNNKLYEYSFVYTSEYIASVVPDISVKEWKANRFIDFDGNIYGVDGTSINEEYTNAKIQDIYDYGYVLDANGNIWEAGWYTYGGLIFENLENTELKKVSTSRYVFAAIDSDNNLLINNFGLR